MKTLEHSFTLTYTQTHTGSLTHMHRQALKNGSVKSPMFSDGMKTQDTAEFVENLSQLQLGSIFMGSRSKARSETCNKYISYIPRMYTYVCLCD